jgi:hypothetical protein
MKSIEIPAPLANLFRPLEELVALTQLVDDPLLLAEFVAINQKIAKVTPLILEIYKDISNSLSEAVNPPQQPDSKFPDALKEKLPG